MISARAYGLLMYISQNPEDISATSLANVFSEGRGAILSALKELREAGFLVTSKEQINGKWVTFSKLPESDFRTPVSRLLIQQYVQNSNNTVIPNSLRSKPNTSAEPMGGLEMGYEFFDKTSSLDHDERASEAAKHAARKKAEYEEAKTARQNKNIVYRANKPLSAWTATDVAYEFATRLHAVWHIKPWEVTKSRFIQALAESRKKFDTDGTMELEMMDRFFRSLQLDKHSDADILWKMFIKRFPEYAAEVRNTVKQTADVTEEEQLQTARSIARFED